MQNKNAAPKRPVLMAGQGACGGALKKCLNNRCVLFTMQVFRWLPVLFIFAVIVWSYYAFVVALCITIVDNAVERVCMIVLYHLSLSMFMWSYWRTMFSTTWTPPHQFKLSQEAYALLRQDSDDNAQHELVDKLLSTLPLRCRTFDGGVRFCDKCRLIKPDRAHHCSVCDKCILKMDHHCPWVNACVHFGNYKYFLLFLGYGWLLCIIVALADLKYVIMFWTAESRIHTSNQFHIVFLFFVACMFFVSISTLFFYHLWLTCKNRSTLESFTAPIFACGPRKDGFDCGCRRNFLEVFGTKPGLWFVPLFSSLGDGVTFKSNSSDHSSLACAPP